MNVIDGPIDYANIAVAFFLLSSLIIGVALIMSSYIIRSLTIFKIAQNKKMPYSFIAWIPIVNNYILIKEAKGTILIMFTIIGMFIPNYNFIFLMCYLGYMSYIIYKVAKEYEVNSKSITILGAFIPFVILLQYIKIYRQIEKGGEK